MIKLKEKEFYELFGEVKVVFSYYYKYIFTFIGQHNGKSIYVNVGGSGDDIYRLKVDAGEEYVINDLDVTDATVYDNGEIIYEY